MRCFEVYGQAICHFSAPTVALNLQEALSDYRVKLSELSMHYTFESVKDYHLAFVALRVLMGQDDPSGWRNRADDIQHKLIQKPSSAPSGYKQGALDKVAPGRIRYCHDYQKNACTRGTECRYTHICNRCNGTHGAAVCKAPATNANDTALGARISGK